LRRTSRRGRLLCRAGRAFEASGKANLRNGGSWYQEKRESSHLWREVTRFLNDVQPEQYDWGDARRKWQRRSIAFYRKGSAVVAEIAVYLLGLFLAHEWLKNLLAIFCFLIEIAHFLKFSSAAHSAEPNRLRLVLPFGGDVLSVVFQKATGRVFWDFRHLNGLLTFQTQRENSPKKRSPRFESRQSPEPGRRSHSFIVPTSLGCP
jgi:hypothetical protein